MTCCFQTETVVVESTYSAEKNLLIFLPIQSHSGIQ